MASGPSSLSRALQEQQRVTPSKSLRTRERVHIQKRPLPSHRVLNFAERLPDEPSSLRASIESLGSQQGGSILNASLIESSGSDISAVTAAAAGLELPVGRPRSMSASSVSSLTSQSTEGSSRVPTKKSRLKDKFAFDAKIDDSAARIVIHDYFRENDETTRVSETAVDEDRSHLFGDTKQHSLTNPNLYRQFTRPELETLLDRVKASSVCKPRKYTAAFGGSGTAGKAVLVTNSVRGSDLVSWLVDNAEEVWGLSNRNEACLLCASMLEHSFLLSASECVKSTSDGGNKSDNKMSASAPQLGSKANSPYEKEQGFFLDAERRLYFFPETPLTVVPHNRPRHLGSPVQRSTSSPEFAPLQHNMQALKLRLPHLEGFVPLSPSGVLDYDNTKEGSSPAKRRSDDVVLPCGDDHSKEPSFLQSAADHSPPRVHVRSTSLLRASGTSMGSVDSAGSAEYAIDGLRGSQRALALAVKGVKMARGLFIALKNLRDTERSAPMQGWTGDELASVVARLKAQGGGRILSQVEPRDACSVPELRRKYTRLEGYALLLADVQIDDFERNEREAFFLNVYNMLFMHTLFKYGLPNSHAEAQKMLRIAAYNIAGHLFTLEELRFGILRCHLPSPQVPRAARFNQFPPKLTAKDPRSAHALQEPNCFVMFGMVDAREQGPIIRIYQPETVDHQLKLAGQTYLRDNAELCYSSKPFLDVYLPSMFDVYRADLGRTDTNILKWLSKVHWDSTMCSTMADFISAGHVKIHFKGGEFKASTHCFTDTAPETTAGFDTLV